MVYLFWGLCCSLLSAWPTEPAVRDAPELHLMVGEQRLLFLGEMKRFSISGAAARGVRVGASQGLGDKILLKALRPGRGELWVQRPDERSELRTIWVRAGRTDESKPSSFERRLGRLGAIEAIALEEGFALRGEIGDRETLQAVGALVADFPKRVLDQTTAAPALLEEGRARLAQTVLQLPQPSQWESGEISGRLWVRGSVSRADHRITSLRLLREAFPTVDLAIDVLETPSATLHLQITLLEVRRKKLQALGVRWPSASTPQSWAGGQGLMNLSLEHLETDGAARVLSSPELVLRVPGEAELFSGGELPIRVKNPRYANVVWKSYGLLLKVKALQLASPLARLEVETEQSHLDSSHSSEDGVPGLQTNRLKTQVDARVGERLLLTGLVRQDSSQIGQGIPWLRQIPVLGLLAGGEESVQEQSELVAILLPKVDAPRIPEAWLQAHLPAGPLPPPRQWLSPDEIRALRQSKEFPWNAMQQ